MYYYFSDHLGSADVVTDASGNIKEESDYYPFGGERVVTDSGIRNNYKFTGKERDPETGCDYFGARYYCNPIGRFITPDWAGAPTAVPYAHFGNPQSLNLYSYVQNNPTTFGDPDGHCPDGICENITTMSQADVANKAQATTDMSVGVLQSVANAVTGTINFFFLSLDGPTPSGQEIPAIQPKNEGQADGQVVGNVMMLTTAAIQTAVAVDEAIGAVGVRSSAVATADAAQAQGRTSGTAAALRTADGTFTDVSAGKGAPAGVNHPEVQQALDNVPAAERSPYHGGCAEVGCLNQAKNAGAEVQGSRMATAKIRKPGNPSHGQPNPPCSTCRHVMDQMGVNHD